MPEDFKNNLTRDPDAFDQALVLAEKAARRRQRLSIVLAFVWVASVLAAVYYFTAQIDRVQARVQDALTAQESLQKQIDGMTSLREEIFALRGAQERKASAGAQGLDEFSYALKLAQAEVAFEPLSRSEQELLAAQRQKAETQQTAEALYLRGSALVRGKPAEAIKLLDTVVKKDPKNEPAWVALGSAYRSSSNYPQAEEALRTAMNLNGKRTFTRSELCYVLRIRGTAEKDPACGPSKDPASDNWQTFHDSAFGYYQLGKYEDAEKDWRKAAELSPSPAGSLENLGLIYLRKGQWQKAIDNAQTVNLIDARSAWNWLVLSIAADRLAQKDLASTARAKWKEFRSTDDVESLKPLLPADMQSYLTVL